MASLWHGSVAAANAAGATCCAYCAVPLAQRARVVCAVCLPAWSVSSCVDCFSVGAAWAPHHASHAYVLVEEVTAPVFQEGWSAEEEWRLLDAVARFGPANWKDVGEAVGGGKGARACEAHYERVYLGGKDGRRLDGVAPLPKEEVLEAEAVLERREEEARKREVERVSAAKEVVELAEEHVHFWGASGGVCAGRTRKASRASAQTDEKEPELEHVEEENGGESETSDEDFVPLGMEEDVLGDDEEYYECEIGDAEGGGEREPDRSPGDDDVERRRRKKGGGGAVTRRRRNSRLDVRRRRRKIAESDGEAEDDGATMKDGSSLGRTVFGCDVKGGAGRVEDVVEAEGVVIEGPTGLGEDEGQLIGDRGGAIDAEGGVIEAQGGLVEARSPSFVNTGGNVKEKIETSEEGEKKKAGKVLGAEGTGVGEGEVDGNGDVVVAAGVSASASGTLEGWFEKRGDFDVEFDNDAEEEVLADLAISPDDSEEEQGLKMRLLDIFNARLDERERAKSVVISRGMLDFPAMVAADHAIPSTEREVTEWLARFDRILEPTEAALFREAVLAEHRLNAHHKRIERYRSLGCRTFADARQYDLDAVSRMRASGFALDEPLPLPAWEPPLPTAMAKDPVIGQPAGVIPDLDDENPGSVSIRAILPSLPLSKQANVPKRKGHASLSLVEQGVCSALRLMPGEYASLKEAALKRMAELEATESEQPGDKDDVVFVTIAPSQKGLLAGVKKVGVFGAGVSDFTANARFMRRREAASLGFDVRPYVPPAPKMIENDEETVHLGQAPISQFAAGVHVAAFDTVNPSSVGVSQDSHEHLPAAVDALSRDAHVVDAGSKKMQNGGIHLKAKNDVTEPPVSLFAISSNPAKLLPKRTELSSTPEYLGLTPPLRSSEPELVAPEAAPVTPPSPCRTPALSVCPDAWDDPTLDLETTVECAHPDFPRVSRETEKKSLPSPVLGRYSTIDAPVDDKEDTLMGRKNKKASTTTRVDSRTPRRKCRSSTRKSNAMQLENGSATVTKRKRGRGVSLGIERTPKRQRLRDPSNGDVVASTARTRLGSGYGSSPKPGKLKTAPSSSFKKSSSPGTEAAKASPAISTRSLRSNDSVTRSGRLRQ